MLYYCGLRRCELINLNWEDVNLGKEWIFVRCGIKKKGYSAPSFRHGFTTRLLNKDVSLVHIKNLMGHRSLESTQIYLHVTGKELVKSINSL